MIKQIILTALCLAVCQASLEMHFMDCKGNMVYWSFLRRCCVSAQLPNGCECFDISYWTDFTNTLFHKPECPKDIGVKFYFYNRENWNNSHFLSAGGSNVAASPFKGEKRTVFVTHGFTDFGPAPWMLDMKNELLESEDLNVILVNWRTGAEPPNYYQAAANTRTVGAMIGRLITDFNKYAGAAYEDFHLVGHSLGAHIMGYAGMEVFRLTDNKIGRISGLDPAGPAFEGYSHYVRLDSMDATFVEVIHTDAESFFSAGFGIQRPIAHVDFYVNGGKHQPGCPPETYGLLSLLSYEDEVNAGACSHSRATKLFTNSISKCHYDPPGPMAKICTMGYRTDASCRGIFYPNTTDVPPYC